MTNRLLEILGSGLNFILPEVCHSCRKSAAEPPYPICRRCRAEIFSSPSCPLATSKHITGIWSCRPYSGALRECIREFKYRGARRMTTLFSDLLNSYALENDLRSGETDVIVPVPLHPSKLRERGYNQAGLIAEILPGTFAAPALHRALLKIKSTCPQMGLTREMRLENLKGSFAVVDKTRLMGKTVLLTDDVMTTGATLETCAEELLRSGAAEVKALTLARVI